MPEESTTPDVEELVRRVNVGVDGDPFDEAVPPGPDDRVAEFNELAAANRPPTLEVHGETHAIAEVAQLLDRLLPLLVRADPNLEVAAYRLATLNDTRTHRRRVPDCIRRERCEGCIEVAAIEGRLAQELG